MNLLIEGIFEASERGFGFVRPDDENEKDIFIPPADVKGAWDGDKVQVRLVSRGDEKHSPEGIIIKIIERSHKKIIGRFEKNKNFGFVIPENKKITEDIFIPKSGFSGARNNELVTVNITKWPEGRRAAEGVVVERLGKIGKPGVDILAIMYEHELKEDFPDEVLAQVEKIPDSVLEKEYDNREDLRDVKMVTIDGEDAKDLDDAVSISKLDNGNYLLGVHIADVSYYVKEGTALDKEAYERGTSVYLVDRVIPMLPRKLSNGICSLNNVCCLTENPNYNEIMSVEDFNDMDVVIFENEKFSAFKSFKKYLTNRYGNYMELPPVEKRGIQHNFTAYMRDDKWQYYTLRI